MVKLARLTDVYCFDNLVLLCYWYFRILPCILAIMIITNWQGILVMSAVLTLAYPGTWQSLCDTLWRLSLIISHSASGLKTLQTISPLRGSRKELPVMLNYSSSFTTLSLLKRIGELFPHHVGVICTLLELPKCNTEHTIDVSIFPVLWLLFILDSPYSSHVGGQFKGSYRSW